MWPLVLDTGQGQKGSIEGDPSISSRICLDLPLRCPGEDAALACWHCSLIHTTQAQCLFITRLLKLLDVLLAYYPLGEFKNRTGKTHRGLIFPFLF